MDTTGDYMDTTRDYMRERERERERERDKKSLLSRFRDRSTFRIRL